MPIAPQPAAVPPDIPAADPLLAATLRAGLEAYLRGDYRHAAERFADAAAVTPLRPESPAWRFLADLLGNAVALGALANVDALVVDLERRR